MYYNLRFFELKYNILVDIHTSPKDPPRVPLAKTSIHSWLK